MKREISVEQAINGKRDFYAKKWQQNGYYPIYRFVYHPETDEFEEFCQKSGSWHSWGISRHDSITNKDWWEYIFKNNAYKLCFEEMTDNRNYNVE